MNGDHRGKDEDDSVGRRSHFGALGSSFRQAFFLKFRVVQATRIFRSLIDFLAKFFWSNKRTEQIKNDESS